MTNNMDVEALMKLYKMKKDNPKDYEEFLVAVKSISKDLMTVSKEIMEGLE